jgi:hypothetical protein
MRKADRTFYEPLTKVMLKNLSDARQAADVGGIAAFRYLERENLLPEDTKLTAKKICNWLTSPPQSINKDEYELALRAFQDIAANPKIKADLYAKRGPTLSSRESMHREKIAPELRRKLEALKARTKNLGVQKVLERSGAPRGLNPALISAIMSGKVETLHVKHLEHLERLFDHYGIR